MVRIIFDKIIQINRYYFQDNWKVAIHVIIWSAIIYLCCTVIDTVRRKLIEEPLFRIKIKKQ